MLEDLQRGGYGRVHRRRVRVRMLPQQHLHLSFSFSTLLIATVSLMGEKNDDEGRKEENDLPRLERGRQRGGGEKERKRLVAARPQ